jgi:hypothetical protein
VRERDVSRRNHLPSDARCGGAEPPVLSSATRRRRIRCFVLPPLIAFAVWVSYGLVRTVLDEGRSPLLASGIAAVVAYALIRVLNDIALDRPEIPIGLALLAYAPLLRTLLEGPRAIRAQFEVDPMPVAIHLTLALLCAVVAGPVAFHLHLRSRRARETPTKPRG